MVRRQSRQRIPRRNTALILAAALLMVALAWMEPVAAHAQDAGACAAAKLLVNDRLPRRAVAMLESSASALSPACRETLYSAESAVQRANLLVKKARDAVEAEQWEEARKAAEEAKGLDSDNEQAEKLLQEAEDGAKVAAEAKQTAWERLKKEWDDLFDGWVSPMGGLLAPLLVIELILLAASRLLVLGIRAWPPADAAGKAIGRLAILVGGLASCLAGGLLLGPGLADVRSAPMSWQVAVVIAAVGIVAAVALIVAGNRTEPKRPGLFVGCGAFVVVGCVLALGVRFGPGVDLPQAWDERAVWVSGLGMAGFGVFLTAWWLGTRMRLEIKSGKDGTDSGEIGTVVALLHDLGVDKPRGLEVPRGSDVTALGAAFAELPDNQVLKWLLGIVRVVLGNTPWTATIDGDATRRTVSLARNGRSVASAVIDPKALSLVPGTKATDGSASPDRTLHMAAAFILASMAQEHPTIRRGLAGVTNWKSLGYHYLGTTQSGASEELRRLWLGNALAEDPHNWAAKLAFRHAMDRRATDAPTLRRYADFLDAYEKDMKAASRKSFDPAPLKLRARYTRALILINEVYATEDPGDLVAAARTALEDVATETNASVGSPDLAELRRQLADDIAGPLAWARGLPPPGMPSGPVAAYNTAATYASRHDVSWTTTNVLPGGRQGDDDARAVPFFRLACADPSLREWMTDDPQLTKFRERAAYRGEFLAEPRSDFFALAAVKPFAERLRAAGLLNPRQIAGTDTDALTEVIAPRIAATQIWTLAGLHGDLSRYGGAAQPLKTWAVEVLDELSTRGIARRNDLPGGAGERAELAGAVIDSILKTCRPTGAANGDLTAFREKLVESLTAWMAAPAGGG